MFRKLFIVIWLLAVALVVVFGQKLMENQNAIVALEGEEVIDASFVGASWANNWALEKCCPPIKRVDEVNLAKVKLVSLLKEGEEPIPGDEWERRLGDMECLDARLLKLLWEKKELIPSSWKKRAPDGSARCIFFPRDIFLDSTGARCVMYLTWQSNGEAPKWHLGYRWLGGLFNSGEVVATIN